MKQTVKTIKKKGDTDSPGHLVLETTFEIGQEIDLLYYIQQKPAQSRGYISAFQPGGHTAVSRFLITDILASTMTTPPCVMIELKALDPKFYLRYPVERYMLLPESEVLKHLCRAADA